MNRPLSLVAILSSFVACAEGRDTGYEAQVEGNPSAQGATAADGSSETPAPVDAADEMPIVDAGVDASGWPTCDTMPSSANITSIPDIFATSASSSTPVQEWIERVFVTAISGSKCTTGQACQIFVQDASYATLQVAAHHAIRIFISPAVSQYFTQIALDDRVNVLGYAVSDATNEGMVVVSPSLPGCMKKNGTGKVTPVTGVLLSDLTHDAYKYSLGPVLVKVSNLSGKPDASPMKTFGLWPTGDGGPFDAGPASQIVSLSPFFLPSNTFIGLTGGQTTRFATVTGVFGLFAASSDAGPRTEYLEIYPRTSADILQ